MAYPYDGMFYPTLPQDTQDFGQVLSGVGRSLREIGRSTQYLPYDVLGAPVDLATLALRPMGYTTERPVGGSDWLIELARQYGLADRPTGSGIETATRLATGITSPTAVPRAVGRFAQGLERASDITTEQANRAADALVRQITGNPTATAPQVLEATSMPFMQAVAPKAPSLLEAPAKSDLGFYSALEQATIPLQNKGTGSQFLAQIEKTAGVKPEEIQWTGLDEFLRDKKSVTKAEIQDYLNANRVDVQEVRLGDYSKYGLEDMWEASSNRTKFSQYTLPGGQNYREILLTMPGKATKFQVVDESGIPMSGQMNSQADAQDYINRYKVPGGMFGNKEPKIVAVSDKELQYKSSHFDQPNILAHMRVNDRVVDGKKTLFIEEIQSDWHQAGRKKGYGPQTETEAYYITPDGSRVSLGFGKTQEEAAAAVDPGWKNLVDIKFDTQTKKFGEGVPDAPFKTTWHELSLKRAIQEASEKGYDQIAFTTGKTQAERYDLSKQVKRLVVAKSGDQFNIGGVDINDQPFNIGKKFANELSDVVGKDLAEKISKQQTANEVYAGKDLVIGGEGMKGFYDQILPKTLEKMGKKFDAKVGKTDMDGVEVWQMDITPKMRESVLTKGQPLFAATPALPALGLLGGEEE